MTHSLSCPSLHGAQQVGLSEAHVSADLDECDSSRFDKAAHHALVHGEDFCGLFDG
jgi:hypothetical protein